MNILNLLFQMSPVSPSCVLHRLSNEPLPIKGYLFTIDVMFEGNKRT